MEENKKETYEDYDSEINELDDTTKENDYELYYQVLITGYDDNDQETSYCVSWCSFPYDQLEMAIDKAESIKLEELERLTEREFYVRVEVWPVIVGKDITDYQPREYSRVIVIK